MLIYRDVRNPAPTAHRIPVWLEGSRELVRQRVEGRDWLWHGSPVVRPSVPAQSWSPLPDDFEVASVGELNPETLLRARPELLVTEPIISDGKGRKWRGLVVIDGDGFCRLTLGWGRDPETKQLKRMPEPWQKVLLTGAHAARAEIEAKQLDKVPVEPALTWLLPLLCEMYHLCPEVIIDKKLVDDRLATDLLRVAAGYAPIAA